MVGGFEEVSLLEFLGLGLFVGGVWFSQGAMDGDCGDISLSLEGCRIN